MLLPLLPLASSISFINSVRRRKWCFTPCRPPRPNQCVLSSGYLHIRRVRGNTTLTALESLAWGPRALRMPYAALMWSPAATRSPAPARKPRSLQRCLSRMGRPQQTTPQTQSSRSPRALHPVAQPETHTACSAQRPKARPSASPPNPFLKPKVPSLRERS